MSNQNFTESKEPIHLGDGAYCTPDGYGGIILTANHHDPGQATDTVYLDSHTLDNLIKLLQPKDQEHIVKELHEANIVLHTQLSDLTRERPMSEAPLTGEWFIACFGDRELGFMRFDKVNYGRYDEEFLRKPDTPCFICDHDKECCVTRSIEGFLWWSYALPLPMEK